LRSGLINVDDVTLFEKGSRILIEDKWKVAEFVVSSVVTQNDDSSGIIQIKGNSCYNFLVSDNTQIIKLERFIFNSWPTNIDYGKIFKGTMLKAATIDWFAWEEEIQNNPTREPTIL
jgi:hypothetical protein